MEDVYIALGANLSDPRQNFIQAIKRMADFGLLIKAVSGLWSSPAWPAGSKAPDYLNACLLAKTQVSPLALLDTLQGIEGEFGRIQTVRNAPRSLDLDIVDYGGRVCDDNPQLILPHPRMYDRGFVLFPLEEIAKGWIDPVSGCSIISLIEKLPLDHVAPIFYQGKFIRAI